VGKIPFHRGVIEAMVNGKTVVEAEVPEVAPAVKEVWEKVMTGKSKAVDVGQRAKGERQRAGEGL